MGATVPLRGSMSQEPRAEEVFAGVLADAVRTLESSDIDYVLIGGVGSAALGRPRWTHDIDVLVAPVQAERALDALAGAGFETERTNEHWIFKATLHGIVVDLIFRTVGDIYLDDEMVSHARSARFVDVAVRVASPEDQVVIKAIAHDEPSARHWNDALALLAACEIDWDYLLARAMRGAKRVLSLLVYAQSNDLVVPAWPIVALFRQVYEMDETHGAGGR
jgi:predicted nucleotidyltransferase